MGLQITWFLIIAVAWTVFFVLEGFDFGVGFLARFVGRNRAERETALGTIGPFWDGNEVWLIVGGAAIFAAFPGWYATWFSAGYLALLIILFALIIRGVSFEYADRVHGAHWKTVCSGDARRLDPRSVAPRRRPRRPARRAPGRADQEFTGNTSSTC